MTTLSRLPLRLSLLPMMVSDSPPRLPGTQDEYMSAVSLRLKPASTNSSSRSNDRASAVLHRKHFGQRPAVQQKATIGQAGADLSSRCNSSEKAVMAILSELV